MNRTLLIVIIIAGVGIIGGLIGFLVNNSITSEVDPDTSTTTVITETPTVATENSVTINGVAPNEVPGQPVATEIKTDAENEQRALLKQQALTFAATFGSYSNQNNNEHLVALLAQTIAPVSDQFKAQIAANEAQAPVGSYQGTTTIAVSADIRALTDVTATVVVSTSRIESSDNQLDDRQYTQNITLIFKKLNEQWLVSEADWGEEA